MSSGDADRGSERQGSTGGSPVSRRGVLRGAAATGVAATSLTAFSGSASAGEAECLTAMDAPDGFPVVEKDEHLFGGSDWVTTNVPQGEAEVLVYVHGWLELFAGGAADQGYTLQTALRKNGYGKPTFTYKYPTNSPNWWGQKDDAEADGRAFATWLQSYRDRNPDTTIRMVVHSLGARTGLACLDELVNVDGYDPIESFAMLGGAIHRDAITVDGEFGDAVANGAGQVNNYYSTHDNVMAQVFTAGEFGDEGVGAYGAPDGAEVPDNYTDHDVSDVVKGHCEYYKPGDGCVPRVVENFSSGDGGDGGNDDGGWLPF
ncbi:MAG: DUF726 domain-containing protein [Haloarculaceae archaeon]